MRKILALLVLIVASISCEQQQITDKYQTYKVQGIDRQGNSRVCFNDPDTMCADIADLAEEEFAQNCKDTGNIVHSCGCHEYVCEKKVYKGYDSNGDEKSCSQMTADTICTQEFTDEDQYALDCQNDGGQAIQCGCHDYICIYPEQSNPDPHETIEEFLGTNQDGVVRSCAPQADLSCTTEITKAHIYAQNCKEEGHKAIWCSCQEVLCLDQ